MLVRFYIINHFFSVLFSVWLRLGVAVAVTMITACSAYDPITPASPSAEQAAYLDDLRRDHQGIPSGYIVKYNHGGCHQSGAPQSAVVEVKQTHQDISELHAGNIVQFFEAETQPVAAQEGLSELKMLNRLDGQIATTLDDTVPYPAAFDDGLVYKLMSHNSMMSGGDQYGYQSVNQGLKGKGKGKVTGPSQMASSKSTPYYPVQQQSGVNQGGKPVSSYNSGYNFQNTAQGAGATSPGQLSPKNGVNQQQVHQGQVKGKGRVNTQVSQTGVSQQTKVIPSAIIPSTTKHLDPRQVYQHRNTQGGLIQSTHSYQPDYQLSSDFIGDNDQESLGLSCQEDVLFQIRDHYRPVAPSSRLDGDYYWGYYNAPQEIVAADSRYYVFSKPTCSGTSWCQEF